jgi:biotin transport system substrate-specific component
MGNKTKNMILTSLFAALTAIGAYMVIPVGPAPITLQLLFTVMAGVFLGARYGALSQIIYILMGLAGLPVFAGGAGGFSYIFAPSFGYVIGFVAAAFLVGKLLENDKRPGFLKIFISCLLGTTIIYAIGYPYLYLVLTRISGASVTFQGLLKPAVLVFLPGDLVKITLAAYAGKKMVPIIKR